MRNRAAATSFAKSIAWTMAEWLLPKTVLARYHWQRSLAYQQRLADQIMAHYGTTIQAGPFMGVNYLDDADDGCLVPKLLGCYEEELAPVIEQFISNSYDRVIDVGCASGYYVAGFALRLPDAQVFGFDTDQDALTRCRTLLKRNGIDTRVTLGGWCTPQDLEQLVCGRTLIVVDCEGGEANLLQPDLVPSLRHADLIVELHDFIVPSISATIERRFAETHSIEQIASRPRNPALYPALGVLPRVDRLGAVDERRVVPMNWAILKARYA